MADLDQININELRQMGLSNLAIKIYILKVWWVERIENKGEASC